MCVTINNLDNLKSLYKSFSGSLELEVRNACFKS